MTKKLYLTDAQLKAEMDRCLYCAEKPCMKACPANCSPADFIMAAKQGSDKDYGRAAEMILKSNPLGQMCGLTCPDMFCMKACSRKGFDSPIKIPAVQAAILEKARQLNAVTVPGKVASNGKNVAVVGAGPAGMAAVAVLARKGYNVTVFEGSDKVGGAAKLIPEARLPQAVIEKDWEFIKTFGDITLQMSHRVANPADLLKDGYDGVIVAVGEPHSAKMGIPGEDLTVSFMDYLKEPERYKTAGNVAVLGGGAVATDCAVTAKDTGAENVEMFVRRRVSDMRLTGEERSWLMDKSIDITSMTRVEKIEKTGDTYTLYTCKTRFNGSKLEDIPETTIKRPDFAHVIMAVGSIAEAVRRARQATHHLIRVEVEVEDMAQVDEALAAGADVLMLDNMSLEQMREAVARIQGRARTEASGGIRHDRLRAIAETGVDFISMGAITHSARAVDISLNVQPKDG